MTCWDAFSDLMKFDDGGHNGGVGGGGDDDAFATLIRLVFS